MFIWTINDLIGAFVLGAFGLVAIVYVTLYAFDAIRQAIREFFRK